MITKIFW